MGEMITFKRPDGKEASGYLVKAGDNAPGVVVIQEWWGLNDQIKGVADHLSEHGFNTLVPDLYRGKVTVEVEEANHMMQNLDFADAATQDVRGAVQHLKRNAQKAGVIGFCMGGALTILAAVYAQGTDAAVPWYGVPPEEAADTRTIKIPLQGHFALEDTFFTPEQVDALEARLKEGGVTHEIYRYQAKHAFGNETGPYYNADAANLAWERSIEFLSKHLK
jgi:carboxymethylenebutenolidase